MIPEINRLKLFKQRVPRVGGGDPKETLEKLDEIACSPRRRG